MPSAHSEARFFVDLVDRGVIDAADARGLIDITPEEQSVLESFVETPFDARLVRGAVKFRQQVLRQFELLTMAVSITPADSDLSAQETAAVAFLLRA